MLSYCDMAIRKIEIIVTIVVKSSLFLLCPDSVTLVMNECAWKYDFFVLLKVYIVELENK
jgi:hypothetical protein